MRFLGHLVLHKLQKVLLIVAIACLWFGASNIWHALLHGKPEVVEATPNLPTSLPHHVTLRNIALSPLAVVTESQFDPQTVYFPVRSRGGPPDEKVRILLKSKDRELVALLGKPVAGAEAAETFKAPAAVFARIEKRTEATGMQESTFLLRDSLKTRLKKASPTLDDDFSIVVEGEAPSLFRGFFGIFISFVIFVVFGLVSPDPKPSAEPPVLPTAPPPPGTPR